MNKSRIVSIAVVSVVFLGTTLATLNGLARKHIYDSTTAIVILQVIEVEEEYHCDFTEPTQTKQFAFTDNRPKRIDQNDVIWLARIIQSEAGSSWLSDEWKMAVGEVVLNRVADSRFPNTIYDVIHQSGQYYGANTGYVDSITPTEKSIECATRLLMGERVFNCSSVVWQANFAQGNGVYYVMSDSILGNTYFCY